MWVYTGLTWFRNIVALRKGPNCDATSSIHKLCIFLSLAGEHHILCWKCCFLFRLVSWTSEQGWNCRTCAPRMVNGQSWAHCRHMQQTFGHLLFKLNDKTICSIFGAEVLDTLAGYYYLCAHDITEFDSVGTDSPVGRMWMPNSRMRHHFRWLRWFRSAKMEISVSITRWCVTFSFAHERETDRFCVFMPSLPKRLKASVAAATAAKLFVFHWYSLQPNTRPDARRKYFRFMEFIFMVLCGVTSTPLYFPAIPTTLFVWACICVSIR